MHIGSLLEKSALFQLFSDVTEQPILTPYELDVALELTQWADVYHMDYYSNQGGIWSNYTANKAI